MKYKKIYNTLRAGLILALMLFFSTLNAQDIQFAREIIERLCAPGFHGRGYVEDGDRKAAEFIAQKFKDLGIDPIGKDYFQRFEIPVNTLPGNLELYLNNQKLIAGKDFLADPCAPSAKGTFRVMELSKETLLNINHLSQHVGNSKKNFLLIDKTAFKDESKENHQRLNEIVNALKYDKSNPAAGIIILTDEKLVWHGSGDVCGIPIFTVFKPGIETNDPFTTVKMVIENRYLPRYGTQNVMGMIKGREKPDSVIVFSAHYDHLGRMGKHTYFPGANDNASGVAMLLDLARHFATPEHALPYSLVFMAFGAEEMGLLGSKFFVENPLFPLNSIKFLVNLDIAGTGDEGITVVNGSIYKNEFDLLSSINDKHQYLPQVKSRGEACNSDHCLFHLNNVPSFFIYTLGGIKAYHDVYDIPETLPLTKYNEYFKLLCSFVSNLGQK